MFLSNTKEVALLLDSDRLLYGTTKGHKDMVHREQDDYNRQGECLHTNAHTVTEHLCKNCKAERLSFIPLPV